MSTRHTFESARRLGVPEPEWTLRGHRSRVAAPKCVAAPRPKRSSSCAAAEAPTGRAVVDGNLTRGRFPCDTTFSPRRSRGNVSDWLLLVDGGRERSPSDVRGLPLPREKRKRRRGGAAGRRWTPQTAPRGVHRLVAPPLLRVGRQATVARYNQSVDESLPLRELITVELLVA